MNAFIGTENICSSWKVWPQLFPSFVRCGISPAIEQREQLSRMVQVIARDAAEAEGVEVAEGHRRESHHRGRDLVQLGHVWVLQVEAHAVRAHEHEEGERTGEEDNPQAASHAQALISEHVGDAVKRGPARENLNRRRSLTVHIVIIGFSSKVHDCWQTQASEGETLNPEGRA